MNLVVAREDLYDLCVDCRADLAPRDAGPWCEGCRRNWEYGFAPGVAGPVWHVNTLPLAS